MPQPFDPSRLAMARHLAGLSREALAGSIGRTPEELTTYERGQRHPDTSVLDRCSNVLAVQVEFFGHGRARLALDSTDAHFRSLEPAHDLARRRALAHVELIWELLGGIELTVALPAVDLGVPPGMSYDDPVAAAKAVRKAWGREAGAIPHLVRNLEARGVLVATVPSVRQEPSMRHGDIGSFSITGIGRPFLALERDEDVVRRRVSVAHELGHLLLHPEPVPGSAEHESAAAVFAAEFLLPAAEFTARLPSPVDTAAIHDLGEVYGVPAGVVLDRGVELGVYDTTTRERVSPTPGHATRTSYPGEQPELLRRALDTASAHGLSLADLATRLRLPLGRTRDLVGHGQGQPVLRLVADASLSG